MKKIYMTPAMDMVQVAATEMICMSVLGETEAGSGNMAKSRKEDFVPQEVLEGAEEEVW